MASVLAKTARTALARSSQQVRRFSVHDKAHAEEEMRKWAKISKAAVAGVTVFGVITIYNESQHHEEHENPEYSYLRIRTKKFPWKCSDCGPFEMDCIKKCKEELAAGSE